MGKCISHAQKNVPLSILSATCSDVMQDYIYVEAYKEIHVRNAVEGLHMIFPGKITLIPTEEMPQIYKIDKAKPINFKKGQWVRVKSGLYHDDLAMVE